MTGVAIIVYMNEVPVTPRERDYIYVGSFYAFAIFIGMSIIYIHELFSKFLKGPSGAVVATVLGLALVPTVMAVQNWDDHDRSNRYVAHDFAYNYLAGLEENAVVFTNGDNDTFPLWYMQEVENFRTDVRVGCMPFMPQEWYLQQMKRKYYESEPLPISMEYEQFRQGKRGYTPILDQVNQRPVDLKEIIEFVANEDKRTTQTTSTGRTMHYIPASNFKLAVDSAKVVANGTVAPEEADQIVSEIVWTMGQDAIYKDQLMILDMLAHNEWERPIYYTTPGQGGSVRLDEYLELNGLTYRLVPIKGERQSSVRGRINTATMYDNLMNKYRYTNFGDPGIYLDETCRRMMTNLKNNFNRLATQLIIEDDLEKASEVLTKMNEVVSMEVLGYSFLDITKTDLMFKVGNTEAATESLNEVYEALKDNMNYYLSLGPQYFQAVAQKATNSFQYEFADLMRICDENGLTEMKQTIENQLNQYYTSYMALAGQRQ